jgi:hypothetical protein
MFAVPLIAIALAMLARESERLGSLRPPLRRIVNIAIGVLTPTCRLGGGLCSASAFNPSADFSYSHRSHTAAPSQRNRRPLLHLHLCILKPAPPAKPARRHGMGTLSQGVRTTARQQKNGSNMRPRKSQSRRIEPAVARHRGARIHQDPRRSYERYLALAHAEALNGDRIAAENYSNTPNTTSGQCTRTKEYGSNRSHLPREPMAIQKTSEGILAART